MPYKVHILATVRNPELLDAALLVFNTIRVGFPTAEINVWGNGLDANSQNEIAQRSRLARCFFRNIDPTMHDAWIETIIYNEPDAVWICDTDVVFWSKVEDWFNNGKIEISGRWEPQFCEEWTRTIHIERLHTALMYLHAPRLRAKIREYISRFPHPFGATAQIPLIRQSFIPVLNSSPLFYDTLAGLWQAGIGSPFSDEQNIAFEHLHCASYVDLAGPSIGDGKLDQVHRAIYANPDLARGLQEKQNEYYARRKQKPLTPTAFGVEQERDA